MNEFDLTLVVKTTVVADTPAEAKQKFLEIVLTRLEGMPYDEVTTFKVVKVHPATS